MAVSPSPRRLDLFSVFVRISEYLLYDVTPISTKGEQGETKETCPLVVPSGQGVFRGARQIRRGAGRLRTPKPSFFAGFGGGGRPWRSGAGGADRGPGYPAYSPGTGQIVGWAIAETCSDQKPTALIATSPPGMTPA